MPATQPRRPVTALLDAAEGLVAAGQQVVLDRIDLLRIEATEEVRQVVVLSGRVAAAVVLATLGWVFVSSGVALGLSGIMPPALAAIVVGVPHVLVGALLALGAVRSMKAPSSYPSPLDAEATDA